MSARDRILVDSSVWIEFLSPRPGPSAQDLRRLIADGEPVALTGLIVTEILQGLTRDLEPIQHFLSQWEILEPNGLSTYVRAAEIFRMARSRGLTLTTVDTLIATLAMDHRAKLFSLDQDFSRLAKIVPLDLYQPRQP